MQPRRSGGREFALRLPFPVEMPGSLQRSSGKGAVMASHDEGYKLLFSHPRMVEDLLRGFVAGDWVQNLDFSTLEKASGHYVSEDLRERESDMVWRVRWGQDEWLYIYLLLEFQST